VKTAIVAAAALLPFGALVLFISLFTGPGSAPAPTSQASTPTACVSSGPVAGLDDTQASNARTVVAVAQRMAGRRAAVIAISVGLAESGLHVLGNTAVPGSDVGQGSGSNMDSIGIFQQRAGWGTVAQRLDPTSSARLFVNALLADPGWRREPPWVAAQDVQQSSFDGRPRAVNNFSTVYGGNYQATLAHAKAIVAQIEATATTCGTLTGGIPANTAAGSHGLPANYRIPATATPAEQIAISFALAQLDKPYVWAAAGPDAYDCSGLTMAAWARAGVALDHFTGSQAHAGTPVTDPAAMSPGDLILVPGDDGTLAAPRHVGMYIGDGLVVNAADPADGIRVQTFDDFVRVGHGLSTIRHIA
jgi:cell wall-associated NlpC family hydrolase